jgi:methylated-DNA-protein-cysteine methyltransferase-like protein
VYFASTTPVNYKTLFLAKSCIESVTAAGKALRASLPFIFSLRSICFTNPSLAGEASRNAAFFARRLGLLPCFVKPAAAKIHLFLPVGVPTMFSCPRNAVQMEQLAVTWDPVYRLVKQIPRGRVLTYGAVARILRLRGGARSAGRAMAATPSGRGIPWHRVVGDRGKLLIREPYASLQRKLLESEGVQLLESRVDLHRHLWKPAKPRSHSRMK